MTVVLQPEVGIPLSVDMSYADLRVRAEAACNTSLLLADNGLNITPNNEDRDVAAGLAVEYAEDPDHGTDRCVPKKYPPTQLPTGVRGEIRQGDKPGQADNKPDRLADADADNQR